MPELRFADMDDCFGYDPKPTTITYGYDRHERSWCIIVNDQNGFEYESHYMGTKEGCMQWIEEIKKEYGISEVIKYKAY